MILPIDFALDNRKAKQSHAMPSHTALAVGDNRLFAIVDVVSLPLDDAMLGTPDGSEC